jgi:hypothetical protein
MITKYWRTIGLLTYVQVCRNSYHEEGTYEEDHIKILESLEDYGWRSTERSTRSQHPSRQESHRSWGVTSTDSVKDINT